jgi:acetylornithine/N-succinyldiaminopimelate aminotransferase
VGLITTYNPLPIALTQGEGVWVFDEQGNQYLDSFSGIAVNGLGHTHPDIIRTMQQQVTKLIHTSNAFHIPLQEKLAERLTNLTGMKQVFFGNSGAEANEAAIKLARLYGHSKGIETPSIIVMDGAFHGRTMATLTATASRKVRAGFEPFVSGFVRAPFNDINAIQTIAENREDIVAVMLEPIQGEGGIIVAEEGYLKTLAALCEKHQWLLILDEIQTGNGRTGKLFAYMDYGISPDILTTAKGLGNGMPISACLMNGKACDLFKPGKHGSTFGGNPLACATALTVLDVIVRDNLCDNAVKMSALLRERLIHELSDHPNVQTIRGKGLMLGVALDKPAASLKLLGLEHGILLNVTAEYVIRLLPALTINEQEVEELVRRLVLTLHAFSATQKG